jgi:hypothetical protein
MGFTVCRRATVALLGKIQELDKAAAEFHFALELELIERGGCGFARGSDKKRDIPLRKRELEVWVGGRESADQGHDAVWNAVMGHVVKALLDVSQAALQARRQPGPKAGSDSRGIDKVGAANLPEGALGKSFRRGVSRIGIQDSLLADGLAGAHD